MILDDGITLLWNDWIYDCPVTWHLTDIRSYHHHSFEPSVLYSLEYCATKHLSSFLWDSSRKSPVTIIKLMTPSSVFGAIVPAIVIVYYCPWSFLHMAVWLVPFAYNVFKGWFYVLLLFIRVDHFSRVSKSGWARPSRKYILQAQSFLHECVLFP